MRRIKKPPDSKAKTLQYSKNNAHHNRKIKDILLAEQKNICAYTESYVAREDGCDVDHFNPELKATDDDGYDNYFAVKSQWNKEKSSTAKWMKFQPILHPTDDTFESRIHFHPPDARYFADVRDVAANNLINFLNLNDPDLKRQRHLYLERKRKELERSLESPDIHFKNLLTAEPQAVYYIRAINETFGINVFDE